MTDKPNLADARRVTEAATEGPWAVPGFGDPLLGPSDVCTEGEPGYRHIICEGAGHDAEFIAASRTLVPALLAAVDAVLAECDGEIDVHSRHREQSGLDPDHRPCESASRARFAQRIRAAITAHLDIEPR